VQQQESNYVAKQICKTAPQGNSIQIVYIDTGA